MITTDSRSHIANDTDQSTESTKRMSFVSYLGRKRIPNLDGLRGIAVLLVLIHHVPMSSISWIAHFQQYSKHGVSLFFVISGYIVMTLMLREFRNSGTIDTGGFLVRRCLRLWPLYYAILLLEAGLVYVAQVYSPENQALFTDKLACYALYCSNWLETSGQGPFFVSWSLAVEEQFYILLSLLLLMFRPGWIVLIFSILLLVKFTTVNFFNVDLSLLPWSIILSYSEAIILGVGLALLLNHRWFYDMFNRAFAFRFLPAFLLIILSAFILFGNLAYKSDLAAIAFYIVCALLVGACVIRNELPVLGGRVLSSIGLLSYGIYLMHMPILSAVKKLTMDPVLVFLCTLIIILPLAWLSFRFFEEPIRHWGRKRMHGGRFTRLHFSS